jgi:hypothetical protein
VLLYDFGERNTHLCRQTSDMNGML